MVELEGESVVLFRVRPKHIEKTLEELRRQPQVRNASLTMGPYDIVLTAAFKDYESLRKFAERFSSNENVEEVCTHPAFKYWEREKPIQKPIIGWTLIQTSDVDRAFRELQKVPSIERLCSTTGPYNIIASIAANDIREIQTTIRESIHRIDGVRRTETLTSQRTP